MNHVYLTANEASELLRMSKSKLYKMTMCKSIPHYKCGGKVLFKTQELMGDNFYKYDATDANCQGFVRDSLEALGLWRHLSEEAKSSVVQKDLKLSNSKAKVANVLAQARMRLSQAVSKGGKRNKKKTRRGKKFK